MNSRRSFLQRALAFGAGALSLPTLATAELRSLTVVRSDLPISKSSAEPLVRRFKS